MIFRNMKVGVRATLSFALLAALIVALGWASLRQMEKMDILSDEVGEGWLPSISVLGEMTSSLYRVRALALSQLLDRSAEEKQITNSRFEAAMQELSVAESAYTKLIYSPEERAAYTSFQESKDSYLGQLSIATNLLEKGMRDQAIDLTTTKARGYADEMIRRLKELSEINKKGAAKAATDVGDAFDSGFQIVVAFIIFALFLTIILAFALTRSIVNPLARAVEVARVIAGGDLTRDFDVLGSDEPALLLHSLRAMQQNLRETIQQIADSANQLATASEELHAVTEDSTRGLHQQNNEIEQAATAVDEMTAAIDEVARNAVSTSEASRAADKTALGGREQVNQTVDSIGHLAADVACTSTEVEHLAGEIRDIGGVLNVIRSIAEQTNLLALNAAIEAARAGEQGRGFAVVADEVRALAHRTQQSTQEIEQMIATIQQGTSQAVSSMQRSTVRVNSTLAVAKAAGSALEDIALEIASINERNLVIASASEEQAQVAREVDRNLTNIRDLSLQSSAGADQTSAASQGLAKLAVDLNVLVSRFKV